MSTGPQVGQDCVAHRPYRGFAGHVSAEDAAAHAQGRELAARRVRVREITEIVHGYVQCSVGALPTLRVTSATLPRRSSRRPPAYEAPCAGSATTGASRRPVERNSRTRPASACFGSFGALDQAWEVRPEGPRRSAESSNRSAWTCVCRSWPKRSFMRPAAWSGRRVGRRGHAACDPQHPITVS
jgi:hypothetical protein